LENFSQKLTSSPQPYSPPTSKEQAPVAAAVQVPSRPITTPTSGSAPSSHSLSQPVSVAASSPFQPPALNNLAGQVPTEEDHSLDIDWITTGMGLLCALAVGGLVPFWLYIWFLLRSVNP
jgi:serine/threonine-protein kinase